MTRRITTIPIPGFGPVRLQSLTASEGLEIEFQSVTPEGKPSPEGPAFLVAAMWLDTDSDTPRCRDASDLEDMDFAKFQLLYAACVDHRDYISPADLAKNLPAGEADSPRTESWADQTRPVSTTGSAASASVSSASGEPLRESEQANSELENSQPAARVLT